MKIYTTTGDRGKTSLFSGERVLKNNPRIVAYGDLDELNSVIGSVVAAIGREHQPVKDELQGVQGLLLDAGAWLATTPGAASARFLKPFDDKPAKQLEAAIDRISDELPELKQFILPGGHLSAALAHVARTVCRRTERRVLDLVEGEGEDAGLTGTMQQILMFLNRLSDYLFLVARYCNHLHGCADTLWKA
ncbi:ATP--cob(I)alamin adenosyltransferase [Desulfosarcina ovata subsp. sediminis]|uniref:Corrinoid adenosyltransferase n=1 Tax=Desulfosarcina ovata subsp. sediminis TaxID=885957 RepID=A0A5K7ZYL8_9BACT|nr:cob(I)yrinic acid a,c-diamide adenosyltransferase [Desulfosarcina ovata]BBO85373.1 ATP--cob(I)alamin adenosyltransferase [Desulfosarcina ovata subsp. sediminis]